MHGDGRQDGGHIGEPQRFELKTKPALPEGRTNEDIVPEMAATKPAAPTINCGGNRGGAGLDGRPKLRPCKSEPPAEAAGPLAGGS
jgi:hypothetical protein